MEAVRGHFGAVILSPSARNSGFVCRRRFTYAITYSIEAILPKSRPCSHRFIIRDVLRWSAVKMAVKGFTVVSIQRNWHRVDVSSGPAPFPWLYPNFYSWYPHKSLNRSGILSIAFPRQLVFPTRLGSVRQNYNALISACCTRFRDSVRVPASFGCRIAVIRLHYVALIGDRTMLVDWRRLATPFCQ